MVALLKGDGGAIMTIFIGAIITIVFLASIGTTVFETTNTFNNINDTVTVPGANLTLDLEGRELVGSATVRNETISDMDSGGNFTISSFLNANGQLSVRLNNTAGGPNWAGQDINVSYEYRPEGYINDQSGRSVTLLIMIFGALAILVFTIVVLFEKGSLGTLIRGR